MQGRIAARRSLLAIPIPKTELRILNFIAAFSFK
jgi:hypothetical protein